MSHDLGTSPRVGGPQFHIKGTTSTNFWCTCVYYIGKVRTKSQVHRIVSITISKEFTFASSEEFSPDSRQLSRREWLQI